MAVLETAFSAFGFRECRERPAWVVVFCPPRILFRVGNLGVALAVCCEPLSRRHSVPFAFYAACPPTPSCVNFVVGMVGANRVCVFCVGGCWGPGGYKVWHALAPLQILAIVFGNSLSTFLEFRCGNAT